MDPSVDRDAVVARARAAGIELGDDVSVDCFGNTPAMASELGELVRSGAKTATASLLWAWEFEGQAPPKPGDVEVVVDWGGDLLAVIETTEVRIVPFAEVDAGFARDEGEGDLSLAYWREVHWEFFEGECELVGKPPSEEMLVVCQRFRLTYSAAPK